jgi:hypothetical protein
MTMLCQQTLLVICLLGFFLDMGVVVTDANIRHHLPIGLFQLLFKMSNVFLNLLTFIDVSLPIILQ